MAVKNPEGNCYESEQGVSSSLNRRDEQNTKRNKNVCMIPKLWIDIIKKLGKKQLFTNVLI